MDENNLNQELSPLTRDEFIHAFQSLERSILKMSETRPIDLATPVALLTKDVIDLTAAVDKINKALYGNGQLGLITLVSSHSDKLSTYDKFVWAVLGVLISSTVLAIAYLIISHGILP